MPAGTKSNIIRFNLIAYLFTWVVWLPGVLSTFGVIGDVPWLPLFAIGICGPLVAAVWCIRGEEGWQGVKAWFKTGFSRKIPWQAWVLIILLPLLLPALGYLIYSLIAGEFYTLPVLQSPWLAFPTFLLMVTIGGGQEEYGWRGYLLGELDKRWKPWQADLWMVLIHSLWHLPLFFISYASQSTYSFWVFMVFGMGITLLANFLFRKTGGSLLAAVLFHGLVNTGLELFPPIGDAVNGKTWPYLLLGLIFLLASLLVRWRVLRKA